jgi:hypothetical protein
VNTRKHQAAILDAAGYDREQISGVIGCAIRTLAEWRREDEYKAEVEKYRTREVDSLEPVVNILKSRLVSVGVQAVETLAELLSSEDEYVRLSATKAALDHMKLVSPAALTAQEGQTGDSNGAGHTAVIQVTLPDAEQPKAIESSARDVSDD